MNAERKSGIRVGAGESSPTRSPPADSPIPRVKRHVRFGIAVYEAIPVFFEGNQFLVRCDETCLHERHYTPMGLRWQFCIMKGTFSPKFYFGGLSAFQ